MALFPLNPGIQPLGQFDILDSQQQGVEGGEVLTLVAAPKINSATETAAYDALDGYNYATPGSRVAASTASLANQLPLFLGDDGNSPHYFTMFGSVVGGNAGILTSGASAGPHSSAGSGKVTLWDKPGLYEVSVDALSPTFVSSLPGTGIAPGATLGFDANGKLAHGSSGAVAGTGVATFIEFGSEPSLVTTNVNMLGGKEFTRVKIAFHAGNGNRTVTTP